MERGELIAGKYRLNYPLGSGGMAEVWSATNTFTEREVAIKFMHDHVARTPEAAARFLKEAKVSARVNHPNIIDVLDVGQANDGQLFLVMERLNGQSLETALFQRTPPLTVLELARAMIEVASALAAAHKRGILHRDLKPTNIHLNASGAKLLDFGISKFLEEDSNHALTMAGTVLGSPLYMSPEQARGEANLDGRTDIYAFGTILFEALCGYRPYEGKNFNALIVKVATSKPKSIDVCAPHVPEVLRRVVRACMEPDLRVRAASFDDVIALLRLALPELEATPDVRLPTPLYAAEPEAPTGRRRGRHDSEAPPGGRSSGASWQTPNTSYASPTLPPPAKRSSAWVAISGAALVIGVGLGGVVALRPALVERASAFTAPPAAPPPPAATAAPAPELPTVSVDALPKAKGRLSVASSPRPCSVTVDGKELGLTPVAAFELAPGAHQVTCRTSSGAVRTATVTIEEAATAKYRFALE